MPALLAFGEILWDVCGVDEFIGGAPFNVAAHAARCGLRTALYGQVGDDDRGRRARRETERLGIGGQWLRTDPVRPTGWVDVRLDAQGQPSYAIAEGVAWDAIPAPDPVGKARLQGEEWDALVCGTLAQRSLPSREALRELRRALPAVPVVYDVNLRPPHTSPDLVRETLPGVAVLKVNEGEASFLSREWWGAAVPPAEFFRRLEEEYGVGCLVLTRGERGCLLLSEKGVVDIPAVPVRVASAVGAGDAFLAAFLAGWLGECPLAEAARRANRLGAWVASRPEAIPDYPPAWASGLPNISDLS